VSALGSAAAWFSLTIYLAQTLYPLPAQRPELALGLALLGISGCPPSSLCRLRASGPTAPTAAAPC